MRELDELDMISERDKYEWQLHALAEELAQANAAANYEWNSDMPTTAAEILSNVDDDWAEHRAAAETDAANP